MKPSVSKKPASGLLMGDSVSVMRNEGAVARPARQAGAERRQPKVGQYGHLSARRHSTADRRNWPHRGEDLISPRFARERQGRAAMTSPFRVQLASASATNASVAASGGGR